MTPRKDKSPLVLGKSPIKVKSINLPDQNIRKIFQHLTKINPIHIKILCP
jgi:hypothetical protein